MRRLPVRYRRSAAADLADIYRYVLELGGSKAAAERFVGRIKARCDRIGDAPSGGRPRDDLLPGLRTVPFERSAVIAYHVEHDVVRIVNAFYGGRDFEALFGPEGEGA